MTFAVKHNLMNIVIIFLPTLLAYVVYYLGGGNFERNSSLGFTTFMGFVFSFLTAAYVVIDRDGWK